MVRIQHIHDPTPRPSTWWLRATNTERLQRLLALHEAADDIPFMMVRVEGISLIVSPRLSMDSGLLGERLRGYEHAIRTTFHEPLEVYCEAQKDQNKPRDPVQRQRIMDWLQARKSIKAKVDRAQ